MKQLFIVPILFLAVFFLVMAIRPSTALALANGFPPQTESVQFMMPKAGTVLKIPAKDQFGRTIERVNDLAVVAMPSCQSCTLRRISWPTLKSLSNLPVVLIFPDEPGLSYPEIHSTKFRVLVESKHAILAPSLHDFGPNCIWLDKNRKVLRSVAAVTLDAPIGKTR